MACIQPSGSIPVNHLLFFVDPVTSVHTQTIESYWNRIKTKLKTMKGVCRDMNSCGGCSVSKASEHAGKNQGNLIVTGSPGSIHCNQFYFKQGVFCVLCQTILEMGEWYNLHRCKLYDSQGGWGVI